MTKARIERKARLERFRAAIGKALAEDVGPMLSILLEYLPTHVLFDVLSEELDQEDKGQLITRWQHE